ncbi:MAG: 6-bladed beta-propeller [Odoribacter splanchnicus]
MHKFILFPVLFLGIGCSESVQKCPVLTIDVGEVRELLPVSELFDSLRYVPLETNDNSIFKEVNKIEIDSEGNMYILDREGTNAIYKFNPVGKFVGKIGMQGRGPGEYLEATDFVLYQDTIVEIYDGELNKRIYYSCNGNFIKEYTDLYGYGFAEYIHWGDTLAFFCIGGGYVPDLVVEIDTNRYGFFKKDFPELRNKGDYFSVYQNRLYCTDNYNDTIYRFSDRRMEPYLYVNFGDNSLPAHIREYNKVGNSNYCYDVGDVKFSERFFGFSFVYRSKINYVFKDLKNNKLYLTSSFLNDIDGLPFFIEGSVSDFSDCFVNCISSSIILSMYEYSKEKNLPISFVFASLVEKIDENSNPVVVFAYPKK